MATSKDTRNVEYLMLYLRRLVEATEDAFERVRKALEETEEIRNEE
jgi:hypothetical protein